MPAFDQGQRGFQLRFWWLALISAVTLVAGIIGPLLLPNLLRPAVRVTPTPSTVSQASPTVSVDPSLPTLQTSVPVYFVGRGDRLLYREFWNLNTVTDRTTTAVVAAINQQPKDPTYTSYWAQGQVNSVTVEDNVITIDLSQAVFSAWQNRTDAGLAINQVVYTAIANVGDRSGSRAVKILSDGSPNLPIIGVPPEPFSLDGLKPLGPLWVRTPEYGAQLPAGKVSVTGYLQPTAAATKVQWQVNAAGGANVVLAKGSEDAKPVAGQTWLNWTITTELPAGSYQIQVSATGATTQTKLFTLT